MTEAPIDDAPEREPALDLRGTLLELDVAAVAHGGHCVARHDGRVVFVRHAIPGELVRATVTEGSTDSRFLRADAVEVLRASPDRVTPPCPYAGPGACGGCDWQHVSPDGQRRLKAAVIQDQLRKLAHDDRDVRVEELPGSPDGLGWRTRVRYAVDRKGRVGFRRGRSHSVLPVERCLIAVPEIQATDVTAKRWTRASDVEVIVGSGPDAGDPAVLVTDFEGATRQVRGKTRVHERAAGRDWQVAAGGFWQVHPAAADTLVAAVLEAVDPQPGERCLDLYAGVGLFAGALAEAVGADGTVEAVEGDAKACSGARRNLHDLACVTVTNAPVEAWVVTAPPVADVVVLDPPRTGAGADVVRAIASAAPRVVAYVACDPAALARDTATFAEVGYSLAGVRAFDLFPMTRHVECVARFVPDGSARSAAQPANVGPVA